MRDEGVRRRVVAEVVAALESLGLDRVGVVPSPVTGREGNREELAVLRRPHPASG